MAKEKKKQETEPIEEEVFEITSGQMAEFKEKVDALQKECDEFKGIAQKVQAEFDNYRKRNASVRKDALEEGKQDTIKELLTTLDSFEIAFTSKDVDNDDVFVQGMQKVYKLFKDALSKMGLEEIEAEGKQFDPQLHNAVMQEENENYESGQIISVMQKGYKVKDKIIRYAMVKVAI